MQLYVVNVALIYCPELKLEKELVAPFFCVEPPFLVYSQDLHDMYVLLAAPSCEISNHFLKILNDLKDLFISTKVL